MIENKSVEILKKIKKIWIILFAVMATAFFILGIIAVVQSSNNIAAAIVSLIFGLIGIGVGGYLVYLLFDFLINRRQENINYMNARLNNKQNDNKPNDNKEVK